ncbi:MAG: hypothetical protein ACD_37C00596G0001, partial [uncultured bacterium]
TRYFIAGVIIGLCDNYAQGVPQQKTDKFEAQQDRSASLCNYMLRAYIENIE